MMGVFVASMKKKYEDLLKAENRLYAFPLVPSNIVNNEFIILDSGAYALSLRNEEIDLAYMKRLYGFYKKYNATNTFPIIGIAPDVFLNPSKTILNYNTWMKYFEYPVVPVIQFERKSIDIFLAMKQAKNYIGKSKVIAISNPSLTGKECRNMIYIIKYLKDKGFEWIHCLGAGWNTMDCKDWFDLGFDSIDSISYYADAENKRKWRQCSYIVDQCDDDAENIVLHNFNMANYGFIR